MSKAKTNKSEQTMCDAHSTDCCDRVKIIIAREPRLCLTTIATRAR